MNLLSIFKKTSRKRFTKTIFNYQQKQISQILDILSSEVEIIKRNNPGYKLEKFSKPKHNKDGSITYTITFRKK